MNPSPDPEPSQSLPSPRRGHLMLKALSGLALFAALMGVVAMGLVAGCRRPARSHTDGTKEGPKIDPWEIVDKKLRKDTDFVACQAALRGLNDNLRNDEALPRPASLTPERERALALVPLSPGDLDEIHNWNYSAHDPAYLTECLYLRDVAQSLKIPNLTPDQLADLAFAWVCRSVALGVPLLWPNEQRTLVVTAVPPTYVLRRGHGSALERMYVFLALLQQLELEGCLIGPTNPGEVGSWSLLGTDRKALLGGPPRPFWAVGVRIGSDIKMYDPWRGEAFPANWNALHTNPEAYQSWFENTGNLSRIKADDMKLAAIHLAVPVNALSPRMEMLHQKLKDPLGVQLAISPNRLQANFADPKPAFWNPPNDRYAYGRVARTFLPRDLGGSDEAPSSNRLYDLYWQDQEPKISIRLPELQGLDTPLVNDRLIMTVRNMYNHSFLEAPYPRERIQRGQFQVAIRDLTEKRDNFRRYRELLHNTTNVDKVIRDWCVRAKELYDNLARTVLIADKEARAAATAEAQMLIEKHWHEEGGAVSLMIGRSSASICDAEAAFLLALCKHEMAERKQALADHATTEEAARLKEEAAEAWGDALKAWGTYLESSGPQASIPGRIAEATTLRDRAAKYAQKK